MPFDDGKGTGSAADDLLARVAAASVDDILGLLCSHTGLDVAFIGEFTGGRRIIRYVGGSGTISALLLSRDDHVVDTYCRLIAEDEVGPLISDVRTVPQLRDLPVTSELGIGSYIGVPIRLSDGELYGTLCCFGHEPVAGFPPGVRDVLETAASFVARKLEAPEDRYVDVLATQQRIASLLDDTSGLRTVVQPIVDVVADEIVGYEALSRFPGDDAEAPQVWFADAHHVGMGVELEIEAVRRALEALPPAPAHLAVNLSGAALHSTELWTVLHDIDQRRVVIELTEQEMTESAALLERRRVLAERGLRLAVDDLGAGFSSLARLLELNPDMLKFDRFLTLGVADDPRRRALAAATRQFCDEVGITLIAEGVEDEADLDALRALGYRYVQGFLTGRPEPAPWRPTPGLSAP